VRSDSGDDLDPRLVHRLEPLNLLLRILVWDGADEEWRLPSLSIFARVPLDDDLVHQHLGQCAPINSRQVRYTVWLPLVTCFIPSFMRLGIVPAVVSAVFHGLS
jgi:hypothetical protein